MKQQINMRHNLEHMSSRRKRRLNADQVVSAADFKTIKTLLGK
jgi:large subunit ribosomal protein L35